MSARRYGPVSMFAVAARETSLARLKDEIAQRDRVIASQNQQIARLRQELSKAVNRARSAQMKSKRQTMEPVS